MFWCDPHSHARPSLTGGGTGVPDGQEGAESERSALLAAPTEQELSLAITDASVPGSEENTEMSI